MDSTGLKSHDQIVRRLQYLALYLSMWDYYVQSTSTNPSQILEIEEGADGISSGLLAAQDASQVGFFGMPAVFQTYGTIDQADKLSLGQAAARKILNISAETTKFVEISVITESADLTGFEYRLIGAGYSESQGYMGEVDLALPPERLWSTMRRRYRSYVNHGLRRLSIIKFDESNYRSGALEAYRLLHLEVTGRVTRPIESWHNMEHRLRSGNASLVLGHLDGKLVAGTYTFIRGSLALYGSGAYRRDLGNFPVSHAVLHSAIMHARKMGVTRYLLGEVFPNPQDRGTKEESIAQFKRGFASNVKSVRRYRFDTNCAAL